MNYTGVNESCNNCAKQYLCEKVNFTKTGCSEWESFVSEEIKNGPSASGIVVIIAVILLLAAVIAAVVVFVKKRKEDYFFDEEDDPDDDTIK